MLAAGQSAQVTEEDEQGGLSVPPHPRQRDGLTVHIEQGHIGGWVVRLKVSHGLLRGLKHPHQGLVFFAAIGTHIQVRLNERHEASRVFAAQHGFGKLVEQGMDFVAGEFALLGFSNRMEQGRQQGIALRAGRKKSFELFQKMFHGFLYEPFADGFLLVREHVEQFFDG